MPPTHVIPINGLDIAYWDEGQGLPLFFIHGNSSSKQIFTRQFADTLTARYRLVAIDLPGHGESSPLPDGQDYSIPLFTGIIVQCWERLGCQGGIVIGHSLGGHLGMQSAPAIPSLGGLMFFGAPPLTHPPRVEEAFLPNPALAMGLRETYSQEDLAVRDQALFSTALVSAPPFFQEDFTRTDGRLRRDLARCLATLAFGDEAEILRRLTLPIALLHGQEDTFCNGRYLARLTIPSLWRGEIQTIVQAAHCPQWEQPQSFNRLLEAFSQTVQARRKILSEP